MDEEVFDCSLTHPGFIDLNVFKSWLKGYTVEDVTSFQITSLCGDEQGESEDLHRLLRCEIVDQYRTYELLEHFLYQPELAQMQRMSQAPVTVLQWMNEEYYMLDDAVFREILSRKLTSKTRNNLSDIAEQASIPLRSCRRQFDNIKRIFSWLDDNKQFQCTISEAIEQNFAISTQLAIRYTCGIFLLFSRFQIQSNKRKNQLLSMADLEHLSLLLLNLWVGSLEPPEIHLLDSWPDEISDFSTEELHNGLKNVIGFEFNRHFLTTLRDLKLYVVSEKENIDAIFVQLQRLAGNHRPDLYETFSLSERKIKDFIKVTFHIAAGLSQVKELRDLFEDIAVKILEPLKSMHVDYSFVNFLIMAIVPAVANGISLNFHSKRKTQMFNYLAKFIHFIRVYISRTFLKVV